MTARAHQEFVFEEEIWVHLKTYGWAFDGPLPSAKGNVYEEEFTDAVLGKITFRA